MKIPTYESNFKDEKFRGTAQQIVTKYEGKAYHELRAGNVLQSEMLFQQAEHWKKIDDKDRKQSRLD